MEFLQSMLFTLASGQGLGVWGSIKHGFNVFLDKIFELTLTLGIPSYVLAIFIFTLIVKLLLQPLMNKQMRSTRKMGTLQPKLQEIQKKYASNPQRQQEETMKLYKAMGVSPFAGCLPLLVQIPIMYALYQSLREFTPLYPEYYNFFWIPNLRDADPTGIVLPLLVGAASFFQQFLTITNKQDRTQRMMLIMMPVMFIFIMRTLPSGLAFYWIFYSLIGGVIQFVMNKKWAREDAREEEQRLALEQEERLSKAAKKAEKRGLDVEEYIQEEENKNIVEVNGQEYYLPPNYSLRDKRVKAHPYSEEEETITVVVLPDGRERPLSSLKKKESAYTQMPAPSFGSLFGRRKKDQDEEQE